MSTTTKLTDTQLVILSQAAQRPDLRVLPTSPDLKATGGAVSRAFQALLKRGLIIEQGALDSDEEWRRDAEDAPLTVVITPAGLAAIGVEPGHQGDTGQTDGSDAERSAVSSEPAGAAGRQASKGATITALLKRDSGATLAELTAASGWQAHSVRGFLSGTLKKKLGFPITSERREDGVRRYRITG